MDKFLERHLDIHYLDIIIKETEAKAEGIYNNSPQKTWEDFPYVTGFSAFDISENIRKAEEIELAAVKWRSSDEAEEYKELVERLGELLNLRGKLINRQKANVDSRYKLGLGS